MEAYQVLHIPTGDYITSTNRNGDSVLFANEESAKKMIFNLIQHTSYIGGAPISDYTIGALSASQEFCFEEFECISVGLAPYYYTTPKLLSLS